MVAHIQKAMDRRDEGFTLIELLVVIVIIGVLAAIAVPIFLSQRKKGVDAGMKSDLRNAASTIETWIVDHPQEEVPDIMLTHANAAAEGSALEGFRASPGNDLLLTSGADRGSYLISVTNPNSTAGVGQCMFYDSEGGGLKKGFNDCV